MLQYHFVALLLVLAVDINAGLITVNGNNRPLYNVIQKPGKCATTKKTDTNAGDPHKKCPFLSLTNGHVTAKDRQVGNYALFACDEGYYLCGNEAVKCNKEYSWDKEIPTCITHKPLPPEAYKRRTFGHSTYFIDCNKLSWKASETACQTKGGHLISITSKAEQDFLVSFIKPLITASWHIGLINVGGDWQWISGEKLNYTIWSSQEPTATQKDDCTFIAKDNDFNWSSSPSSKCNAYEKHFICEI